MSESPPMPPARRALLGLMNLSATKDDLIAAVRAIATGEPPLAIRKYFRSFENAVDFYAKVRGDQFNLQSRSSTCCDCGGSDVNAVTELCWAAPFKLFSPWTLLTVLTLGHLHVSAKTHWVVFSSYHGFCHARWRRYLIIRILKSFGEALTLVVIFGGAACATGFGLAPVFTDHQTDHDKLMLRLVSGGCAVIAVVGMIIRGLYREMGIPRPIRFIAPRPFQLSRRLVMKAVSLPGPPPVVVYVPKHRPENPSAMSWVYPPDKFPTDPPNNSRCASSLQLPCRPHRCLCSAP